MNKLKDLKSLKEINKYIEDNNLQIEVENLYNPYKNPDFYKQDCKKLIKYYQNIFKYQDIYANRITDIKNLSLWHTYSIDKDVNILHIVLNDAFDKDIILQKLPFKIICRPERIPIGYIKDDHFILIDYVLKNEWFNNKFYEPFLSRISVAISDFEKSDIVKPVEINLLNEDSIDKNKDNIIIDLYSPYKRGNNKSVVCI